MNTNFRHPKSSVVHVAGLGCGGVIGSLGMLVSILIFFIPLTWTISSGLVVTTSGLEYIFGYAAAELIFFRAIFIFLISFIILYNVLVKAIKMQLIITGIIGLAGFAALQYQGNTGLILIITAIMLALSVAFQSVEN